MAEPGFKPRQTVCVLLIPHRFTTGHRTLLFIKSSCFAVGAQYV